MSRPVLRALVALATCCSIAFVPVVFAESSNPPEDSETTTAPASPKPSDAERQMRIELRDLSRAWADGGGTFGYPFWEKAGQRWQARQITSSMYREYVTSYRDHLVAGCELLDQVEVDTETGREVRELVVDSCERRVEALRAQQRMLDERIRRDGSDPDIDVERSNVRIAEHQADSREALQESYRLARIAMDVAQAQLDEAGLDRLPEDSFV